MAFLEYRPTRILYQYCSPDAFCGIVRSKRLWFTDLYAANDPREIRLGHKKFIDAILYHAQREPDAGRRNYLNILSDKLTASANNTRAYCACFSLTRDHLPMWTTYAAQHGGLSIGFRPTALLSIPARIQLVKYVDELSGDDYRGLLAQALRDVDMRHPPDNILNTLPTVVGAFALMTAHKHNSWDYEQEVRMIHMQRKIPPPPGEHELFGFTGRMPDGQLVKWTKPIERLGPNGPMHYLEFPFGRLKNRVADPSRAIGEVIIGPKCALSTDDVTAVMAANGFKDFSVVKSDCQIR